MRRCVTALVACVGSALLFGCAAGPVVPEHHDPPRMGAISGQAADDILAQHDAAVVGQDKLWSRTRWRLRWLDENDRVKAESGEGKLILHRDALGEGSHGTALTAGKLGQTGLWAGSDGARFWVFDLRGAGVVYLGEVGARFDYGSTESPIPVPPSLLTRLVDVLPLQGVEAGGVARTERGYWHVETEPGVSVMLHPKTARAVRVQMNDYNGDPFLIAHLLRYKPVTLDGLTVETPTRIELYFPAQRAHATLRLSGITDQRVKPGLFDFDVLMKTHRPAEVVELQPR